MRRNTRFNSAIPSQARGGWDYITVDSAARRLYVSHSVRVNVLDPDTGAVVGSIEDTPGVHGIAIASHHHGFTSNGKENKGPCSTQNRFHLLKKSTLEQVRMVSTATKRPRGSSLTTTARMTAQ